MSKSEENLLMREKLFYESRIVNAAKAVQETLIFPDSMVITDVLIWEDEVIDEKASTETQKTYINNEPEILLQYLAKTKGGSMTEGIVRVSWENDAYSAGTSVDDLEALDELPWYIDSDDYSAQMKFWSEQIVKGKIVEDIYSRPAIGVFDLERCNAVLSTTLGRKVEIIPTSTIIITPTPRIVTVTPKPAN